MVDVKAGIVGDQSFWGDIPRTEIPQEAIEDLKKKAKFSRTSEFKFLKQYLEGRVEHFQRNLPGGQPIDQVDPKIAGPMWVASSVIIDELRGIIRFYENAADEVKRSATSGT